MTFEKGANGGQWKARSSLNLVDLYFTLLYFLRRARNSESRFWFSTRIRHIHTIHTQGIDRKPYPYSRSLFTLKLRTCTPPAGLLSFRNPSQTLPTDYLEALRSFAFVSTIIVTAPRDPAEAVA